LNVDDEVLAKRRAKWVRPPPKYTRGVLAKYMRLVSTASRGAVTDGRFSGGTWGMVVGHVAPEAYVGGTIALVCECDSITIDANRLLIQLNVDDETLAARRARWQAPQPRYTRGLLAKYMRLVSTASRGAITDAPA